MNTNNLPCFHFPLPWRYYWPCLYLFYSSIHGYYLPCKTPDVGSSRNYYLVLANCIHKIYHCFCFQLSHVLTWSTISPIVALSYFSRLYPPNPFTAQFAIRALQSHPPVCINWILKNTTICYKLSMPAPVVGIKIGLVGTG